MEKKRDMIRIDNVSMRFHLNSDRIFSLKEYTTKALTRKLSYDDFWALRGISMSVRKGETLGVIGKNGAGKSTLLKIVAGILKPTEGTVKVMGNVVPMLELGSGFDMDLTGRENIFLNGAILGYNKAFLESKYQEIVDFSELGRFVHTPIRNYSSGMLMRLAFSIATVVKPEILIVDEILAVGDTAFQEKSKAKMMEMITGGATVLFVSHSIAQIRQICDRVAWLDGGSIQAIGETAAVCDAYESL